MEEYLKKYQLMYVIVYGDYWLVLYSTSSMTIETEVYVKPDNW